MARKTSVQRQWRTGRKWILPTAFVVLPLIWLTAFPPLARLWISLAYVFLLCAFAPVWCGATNRDGTFCRNNASGLLLGCRRVRYHRWQKMKDIVKGHQATALMKRLFQDRATGAAMIGAGAAVASVVVATVQTAIS